MPSFVDALTPEQRWAITDFIVSLSGERRAWLYQPRRRQARPRIRSIWRRAPRASRPRPSARFPIVGQIMEPGRAFHPPATGRDRSGDLRRRVDRPPRSMARHERARRRGRTGRRFPCRRRRRRRAAGAAAAAAARRRGRLRRRGSRTPAAAAPAADGPLCRGGRGAGRRRHPSSPTPSRSRFRRRCRRAPASPTSSSATRQNSVDLWFFDLARPEPLQFTGQGSADIAPNDTGDLTGVASYDQGEWSVIFKRPLRADVGRPVPAGTVPADRLLGLGRVLARARQQARSHGLVLPLRRARGRRRRPSARW